MTASILKRPQAERDIEEAFVFIAERDVRGGAGFPFCGRRNSGTHCRKSADRRGTQI